MLKSKSIFIYLQKMSLPKVINLKKGSCMHVVILLLVSDCNIIQSRQKAFPLTVLRSLKSFDGSTVTSILQMPGGLQHVAEVLSQIHALARTGPTIVTWNLSESRSTCDRPFSLPKLKFQRGCNPIFYYSTIGEVAKVRQNVRFRSPLKTHKAVAVN